VIKRTQKERDQEANANNGNRTAGKDQFFLNLLLLKSKSAKLVKIRQ
jgi:hypothetical protein